MIENASLKKQSAGKFSRVVKKHRIAKHEIYDLLGNKDDGFSILSFWIHQQYFMAISLSQCFAALYVRTPIYDWKAREGLLDLLTEEAWGRKFADHAKPFLELLNTIESKYANCLNDIIPYPETIRAAETRLKISQGEWEGYTLTPSESALVLSWANERINIIIFNNLKSAMIKSCGSKYPTDYFDAHIKDEAMHSQLLMDFAFTSLSLPNLEKVERVTNEFLELRSKFFDGIVENFRLAKTQ